MCRKEKIQKPNVIYRYYFENVFEALNEPGEWYLDKVSGILYYVPKEGEKADTLTLYGSNIDRLIDINGVDGISFEGVHFTRTDWVEPKADGFYTGTWWEENDMDFVTDIAKECMREVMENII